jgi:formylglycine-generating enzyme required for sulfatase activity
MRGRIQYAAGAAAVAAALVAWLTGGPGEQGKAAEARTLIQPAAHKNYTETVPGSKVSFDMVAIPGGTFVMGSPPNEPGRGADEGPQHPVQVRPFWLGKCEVTWDEYDLYWKKPEEGEKPKAVTPQDKAADAISKPTAPYVDETYNHGREGHPAICMTHHAAMEYCRWLSLKTGKTYRLPTEAEWEYACRASTTTPYFFGSDPKQLDDYAWFAKNSEELTHEVGKKKPNPWGLYDVYGNVYEWCLDTYKKDAYSNFPTDRPALSPVLIPGPNRFPHVTRGGCWSDEPAQLRSAARRGSDKSWIKHDPQRPQSIWWLTKWDVVGFRVARAVDEQDNLKGLRSKVTKQSD